MLIKKPSLEKIDTGFESSVKIITHKTFSKTHKPFWHFHPEIELVYVNRGKGKRHIGNHLSYFNNSLLVLIGSNLPHTGFTDRLTTNGSETLIQFKEGFIGEQFFSIPETKAIKELLNRSKKGILFGISIKQKVGNKIEKLSDKKGFVQILGLLEILHELAKTRDYTMLNADGYVFETDKSDRHKIDLVYNYINEHFKEHIALQDIAEVASMTVTAFCRYFKKATGKTFTQLVNEYRIVHATKLLSESQMSVTAIAFECGFNNFSHFNKSFKAITGKNASKYRNEMKHIVQ